MIKKFILIVSLLFSLGLAYDHAFINNIVTSSATVNSGNVITIDIEFIPNLGIAWYIVSINNEFIPQLSMNYTQEGTPPSTVTNSLQVLWTPISAVSNPLMELTAFGISSNGRESGFGYVGDIDTLNITVN